WRHGFRFFSGRPALLAPSRQHRSNLGRLAKAASQEKPAKQDRGPSACPSLRNQGLCHLQHQEARLFLRLTPTVPFASSSGNKCIVQAPFNSDNSTRRLSFLRVACSCLSRSWACWFSAGSRGSFTHHGNHHRHLSLPELRRRWPSVSCPSFSRLTRSIP